ncbi:MAG: hypothetical protein ACRC0G_12385 [Fusobacteriaceae bacterium]
MNIFEQFLQCDTYRGDHSTGVCAIFKPYNGEGYVKVAKAAVDGFDFVKTALYEDVVRHKTQSTTGTTYATFPKAAFGHNRYATIGAVNAENAHPFNVGHITLAHNGTLNAGWKSKLPNGHEFTVDSHCVANAMAVLGVDKLIQLLDGAFTLIWHNAEDKTLNIIRNKERPFHLWETSLGDWFGCSEEKMGDWLLTRGKVSRHFKRHFELEVGVQYVFDVSEGCVLKEERKHELPVFPSYGYYSAYQDRTQGSSYSSHDEEESALDAWWDERIRSNQRSVGSFPSSQSQTQGQKESQSSQGVEGARAKLNRDLKEAGLDVGHGDYLEFEMYEYKEYPKRKGFGYVRGYVPELPEFIEVHVHDVKEEAFQMEARGYVQIISGYVSKHVLTVIGKSVNNRMDKPQNLPLVIEHQDDKEVVDDQDFSFLDQISDDDMPVEHRTMMSGERFSEREWNRSHHNVCSMCSDPIHFDEMEVAVIENGYCFCGDCVAETNQHQEKVVTPEPELVGRESYCVACGGYHGENVISGEMTHANWTSLATTCFWKLKHKEKFTGQGKRPILSLVKKTEPKHTCTSCATDFPLEMMSTEQEDLCSDCYTRFHQATTVRTSFNQELVEKIVGPGMRVSPVLWAKMCSCRQCGTSIPFAIADQVEFWGSAPICVECSDRLDNSEI